MSKQYSERRPSRAEWLDHALQDKRTTPKEYDLYGWRMMEVFSFAASHAIVATYHDCARLGCSLEEAYVDMAEIILNYATEASMGDGANSVDREYSIACKRKYWYRNDYHNKPEHIKAITRKRAIK